MIGDKRLTVFKDQLCRPNPRFDEYNVLTYIHGREGMPGVVEAVYHTLIDMPERFDVARKKTPHGTTTIRKPYHRCSYSEGPDVRDRVQCSGR